MFWIECPVCKEIDVGKVNNSNYYCWNCFIEFRYKHKEEVYIYSIQDDGTLETAYKLNLQGS